MKKIIGIMALLLIVPSTIGVTSDVDYKTWFNITLLPSYQNATNQCGNVTIYIEDDSYYYEGNSSISEKHEVNIPRTVNCDEINPQLQNLTYTFGEMSEQYKGLMDMCQKHMDKLSTYETSMPERSALQTKFDECTKQLQDCNNKLNDYTTCQTNLGVATSQKNSLDSEVTTCKTDKDTMAGQRIWWGIIGALISGLGVWYFATKVRVHKDVSGSREGEFKRIVNREL